VAGLEEPTYTNDCAQSAAGVNEIPAGYLLSLALPPLDTLANPLRSIEGHDLFGAGHERLEALPDVVDTAAVPPVPALQHTHGKSTSGFAGSEPPVPFRGRPPECNTRPLERQDYSRSLDYATEEMATTATPSSTFTPPALPSLLLPLPMVRPLVGCKHLAPAGPTYPVATQAMPAAGGTYMDHLPSFTHYSGFAGIGAFAAAFKHVGGRCKGGFEWCEGTAAVFEKLNPAVRLEMTFGRSILRLHPAAMFTMQGPRANPSRWRGGRLG
jgi:hypothetical protein